MSKTNKNQQSNGIKKKGRRKKIISFCLGILLLLILGSVTYGWIFLKNIEKETFQELDGVTVSEEVSNYKQDYDVLNVALFGVDSRQDSYSNTRSDAIMVLSYNMKENNATITSIVRDTYAFINQDHGYEKINHAYAYGGASLAVQALNQNFDLDIQKYISVNFNVVQKVIDAIGGIEIEIQDYEVNELNRIILEMQKEGIFDNVTTIHSEGKQVLDGQQAVAYMRIRKVGNGDFERMERQRRVIELTLNEVLSMNSFKITSLINQILPYVQTNLTVNEILSLIKQVLVQGIPTVNQLQLPTTDLSWGGKIEGIYYLVPRTLEDNIVWWHQQVYGSDNYQLSSLATRINTQIQNYTGIY